MDCREAQQVFSELFDGETVDEALRAEAETHCASCAECAAFRGALRMLHATPGPAAPQGLADRVLVASSAEAQAAGGAPPAVAPVVAEENAVPWLTKRRAYVLGGAAAAALLIIGIAVVGLLLASNKQTQTSVDQAVRSALSAKGGIIPPGSAAAPGVPATGSVSGGIAPNYVVYQTRVYAESSSVEQTTALTQVGTLTSALASNGSPGSQPVYRLSSVSTSTIILKLPDNSLDAFTPVARTFGALTYVLQSGDNIDRFGQWPTLPSQFNQPTSADGSPTFRSAGTDNSGVTVFTPIGSPASAGIAVGPNAPSTDPSAGNPNWTWWTPI